MKLLILLSIGAYAAGSINFAILLFKVLGKTDPRKGFSGNPGVVNVYRQGNIALAAAVLLLDMGRAIGVALFATKLLSPEQVPIIGLALISGNSWPCFHSFSGGKGVANYLGFSTIIAPLAALISALAWLVTFSIWRIPFVGSFVMVSILGAGTIVANGFHPLATSTVVATIALILYNHRSNIRNLLQP